MATADPARTRRTAKGEKSGKRIESLLATARDVFAEKGYERATTLEIAHRLEISEATVFTYFGSKRELCIEVIRRWYDEISTELERELPLLNGLRLQLQFAVRKHLITLMGERAGLCAMILSDGRTAGTADTALADLIADCKRRYTAPLMRALEAGRASGEVRDDIPLRLFRDMVYGAMEHVLWDSMATGRKPDIERTAEQLSEMLWSAFMPADASLRALNQFRSEVGSALRRLETPGD